ncbi:hypothetical protein MesoLj131c_19660 [Mesorhizobium sp. 131-3-5]|nr:hypothetical protein MesoLj131c_19660 [Mesorhizobium sp. 131-3-5]
MAVASINFIQIVKKTDLDFRTREIVAVDKRPHKVSDAATVRRECSTTVSGFRLNVALRCHTQQSHMLKNPRQLLHQ